MIAIILPLLIILTSHADIFKHKVSEPQKSQTRYIDFQVFGDTISDYTQSQNTKVSLYTITNFDTDFNFNHFISLDTRLEISNTNSSLAQGFATQEYINGNSNPTILFGYHGIRSRIFALNLKTNNVRFMIGKIVPRSGVGASRYNPVFNNDWYGVYGTTLNTGYQNTDKIGALAEFHQEIANGDIYNIQFALYKNDTTPLFTDPLFANLKTNGFLLPANIAAIINKNIAGSTAIPQSFLISLNAKTRLPSPNDAIYYGIMLRRQDISGRPSTFASETSIIASGAFEHNFGDIMLGTFGEFAYINNAYAVKNLTEQYYTFSTYAMLDKLSVALIHNKYFMSNLGILGIASNYLSQTQISFGYTFTNYALYIAYRNMNDNQSNNSLHGIGLNFRYNIGTKNSPFNKM